MFTSSLSVEQLSLMKMVEGMKSGGRAGTVGRERERRQGGGGGGGGKSELTFQALA